MKLLEKIRQKIRSKQNYKFFTKLEPSILTFLYLKLNMCNIVSSAYDFTVKFNGLYESENININLIIKSNENILYIEYKNKKLFKKYSKIENFDIMLIEMIVSSLNSRSNNESRNGRIYNNKKLDPKSEKIEKLNKTLESYQNQYDEILKWEKLNGKSHQDRLMVTSMIENVKDKIEKISNKTV
jgi:hypothetical protein